MLPNHLCNYGRGHYAEHFCEIILNLEVVQREMRFKDISYLEVMWPLCSAEQSHLCSFKSGLCEEQFCEIILNLDQWFRCR